MNSFRKCCLLFFSWIIFSAGLCAERIKVGEWEITLNTNTGAWKSLFFRKEFLLGDCSVRLQWLPQETPIQLKTWTVNQQDQTLTLRYQAGSWQLDEIIFFDAFGMPGLMRRSYNLLYVPEDQSERAQFTHIRTTWVTPKEYGYWRPGALLKDGRTWNNISSDLHPSASFHKSNNTQGILKDLPPGYYAAAFNSNAVAVRTPRNTVMLFLQDIRRDLVDVAIEKHNWGGCFVYQTIRTGGWAYRDVPQKNISNLYLAVVPHSEWLGALKKVMPEWYRKLNWTVPEDRPEWVYGASVYELRSRFGADDSLKRATRLISRAAEEGFDTLHVQPIQKGPNVYNPEDYFKIDPHCGTAEDFRNLVDTAHKSRMKVWLDIVPHGGFPHLVFGRHTPVSWLTFSRNGHLSHPYPCDYKNPDYQNYIASVADYYMKQFKIDGFRIDQPYGSPTNWSTENFPSAGELPPSPYHTLSKEYWEKSLAELGGKMPPLPYERGSLSESEGGMEMVGRIRAAARENNPDGTVHSETLTTVFPQVADVVYDLNSWVKKIAQLNPDEFVPSLSSFLEEQKYLFPPATLFLRIFQNHDRQNPFPSLGTDMGKAAFAVNTLSFGNPVILQYGDTGHSVFLRKLNAIRHSRKELQTGEACYLAVKSSKPAVWTVLRKEDGGCSIGVVNFSSDAYSTKLSFDPLDAGLKAGELYTLRNLWNGQDIVRGTSDKLSNFNLELKPFEVAVISSVKDTPSATGNSPEKQTNSVSSKSNSHTWLPEIREDGNRVSVTTETYTFTVDRKTGLPIFFGNAKGASFGGWDIMAPGRMKCVLKNFRISKSKTGMTIDSGIQVEDASINLTFHCLPEGVRVECSGNFRALKMLAFILPLKNASTWKLNAFDGVLEDPFWETEFQDQLFDINYGGSYRNKTKMLMIWDHLSRMLNPAGAVIDFSGEDGGLSFSLDSALKAQPANLVLLKRLGASVNPALQISLRDYNPITADAPEHFSFLLKTFQTESFPEQLRRIELGKLSLENNSAWYTVENEYFKVTLDRLSGTIRTLKDKKSNLVLLENQLTGGYGLVRGKSSGNAENVWLNSTFTRFDTDATSRIWNDNGILRMRFLAQPHGGRSTHLYPENKLWTLTEYAFNDGRTFSCTVSAFSEIGHFWNDFLHQWTAFLPESISGTGNATGISLCDAKSRHVLGSIECAATPGAVTLEGDAVHVPILSKDLPFYPNRYLSRSMHLSVAGEAGPAPETTDVSLFAKVLPDADPTFEQNMKMALLVREGPVTYPVPDVPGIWLSKKRGYVCYDLGTSSGDPVALKLDKNVTVEIPLKEKELLPGKYQLTFSMKGQAQRKDQPYLISLLGAEEKTGCMFKNDAVWQPPTGNSDWHTQTIPFQLEKKSFGPFVRIQLLDKYEQTAGILWIDNIQISPEATKQTKVQ